MTWIRKKKKFSRPRKLYDKVRIEEENELVKKYGLKNKREIWKAESAISRIRNQGKALITESEEKKNTFYNRLQNMGFKVSKIADVLELNKEDWLKRRLQSVMIIKNMAKPKQARQFIVHKHVSINGKKVNVPSYIVRTDEEESIKITLPTKEMIEMEKKNE